MDWQRPDRYLDVGHSRLAYWRTGHGPDVVFVHGWPLSAATFRNILPPLAESFTCHLIDLPGAGKTEFTPATKIGLHAHGATLRAAIDQLGLDRYAFVSHDSGGFIARVVAADDPRVAGLVMGNTEIPGHNPWLVVLYALMVRVPGGEALVRTLLRSGAIRRSGLGFGGCFTDPRAVDGDFHQHFVAPLLRRGPAADGQMLLLKSVSKSEMAALPSLHAKIRAPVKLIWGTDDPFFPIKLARRMLADFSGGATLDEIPGAKLFAHEDHAREFVALARPFLQTCLMSRAEPRSASANTP